MIKLLEHRANETYFYNLTSGVRTESLSQEDEPYECRYSDINFIFSLADVLTQATTALTYQGEVDLCWLEQKFHQFVMTIPLPGQEPQKLRLLFSQDDLILKYVMDDNEPVHVIVVDSFEEKAFTDDDFEGITMCKEPR